MNGHLFLQSVFVGSYRSFILTSNGTLYGCGDNESHQLGLRNINYVSEWTRVRLPRNVSVKSFFAADFHSVILTNEGEFYTCGSDRYDQLNFALGNLAEWTRVTLPGGAIIQSVFSGDAYSFVLTTNGVLYGCGRNSFGLLGLGHQGYVVEWTPVPLPENVLEFSFDARKKAAELILSDASNQLLNTFVQSLHQGELGLALQELPDEKATALNQRAFLALQQLNSPAMISDSQPSLLTTYDPSRNYLVRYKNGLARQQENLSADETLELRSPN